MDNRIYLISTHKKLGVNIYALSMHPGVLVISEIDSTESISSSSVFLPDGHIDHDEDGEAFIRSKRASQGEMNHQHIAHDINTNTCAIQENSVGHYSAPFDHFGNSIPKANPVPPECKRLPDWYINTSNLIIKSILDNKVTENLLDFIYLLYVNYGDIPNFSAKFLNGDSLMLQGFLHPDAGKLMIIASQSECSFDPAARTLVSKSKNGRINHES